MSPLIFKLFLPMLLGYTLFVGLSGRFNPFSKPSELKSRPNWLLGSWIGLSVALVTGIVLHMAFQLPLDAVKTLVQPTGLMLAALVVPGMIAYLFYSHSIRARINEQELKNMSAGAIIDNQIEDIDFDDTLVMDDTQGEIADTSIIMEDQLSRARNVEATPITFVEAVDSGNSGSMSLLFDTISSPLPSEQSVANSDGVAQSIAETDNTEHSSTTDQTIDEQIIEVTHNTEAEESQSTELTNNTINVSSDAIVSESTSDQIDVNQAVSADVTDNLVENQASEVEKLKAEIDDLKQTLDTEYSLRNHTETHLRITRKALRNLEGDTRDFESNKADALMNIEEQLDSRIKEVAAAQARAQREEASRIEAETAIINMKQDMLEAKRELRRNTEARAKALATANKTVSFARQSVQARTRAEARITQLENRLKLSQETVSSLIAALDKEKARTHADVTEMAKELILQQKRINEKRTLDEASRRTPKRLSRRTAKKVS